MLAGSISQQVEDTIITAWTCGALKRIPPNIRVALFNTVTVGGPDDTTPHDIRPKQLVAYIDSPSPGPVIASAVWLIEKDADFQSGLPEFISFSVEGFKLPDNARIMLTSRDSVGSTIDLIVSASSVFKIFIDRFHFDFKDKETISQIIKNQNWDIYYINSDNSTTEIGHISLFDWTSIHDYYSELNYLVMQSRQNYKEMCDPIFAHPLNDDSII